MRGGLVRVAGGVLCVAAFASSGWAYVIGYDMESVVPVGSGSVAAVENILESDTSLNAGRLNNGATQSTAQAKFGSASALIDGASENLSPWGNSDLNLTGDRSAMTVMAHVYLNAFGAYSPVVGKISWNDDPAASGSSWTEDGKWTFFFENGALGLSIRDGSAEHRVQQDAPTISTGAWHHVAATFDSGTIRLYVDGVMVKQGTIGVTAIALNSELALIGNTMGTGELQNPINGYIDDFYFNSEAVLSDEDIAFYASNAIQAIPEPASLMLLTLGGAALALRRR